MPLPIRTVNENCGTQTINLTGISAGNAGQTVTISAASGNTALIPDPTVVYTTPSTSGLLSYTPVANATGTATITVTVTNSGGMSIQVQFTITVNPVNNPPTLDPIANQTVNENCGTQTINLTGISAGNAGQTVTISAVSGNTAIIPNPTIGYSNPGTTGTLRYTPVANTTGTVTITVTVTNSGGAQAQVQFTITVLAVSLRGVVIANVVTEAPADAAADGAGAGDTHLAGG